MEEIQVKNLTFSYDGDRKVLDNMNFTIGKDENVGLIGANGAGKSTLLKILVGLLEGFEGQVTVAGLPMEKKNFGDIRKKTGYVFQDSESQLFLSTVYEDVAFGPRNYGYSREEVDKKVMSALKKVDIEYLKDRQIYRMSGGQKKLVALATIFSMEPEVILFDEPSIALDPRNRRNLIHILNQTQGTKIIASHDLDMILETCERTILIADNKIIKDGKTKEILQDEPLLLENGLELPLVYQKI